VKSRETERLLRPVPIKGFYDDYDDDDNNNNNNNNSYTWNITHNTESTAV
jgi:hypothetical protein